MRKTVGGLIMLIIRNHSYIFLLFLLFLLSCSQEKTAVKAVYNLDFSNVEIKNSKWYYSFEPFAHIDSTEKKINGKYPICFEQDFHPVIQNIYPSFQLVLHQQLFIPQTVYLSDTIRVSIRNKCYNLSEGWLKFFCTDANDNLLYSDSIDINNDNCWEYKEVTFPVIHAEKMLLGIYALGYDYPSPKLREVQKLYIDRIGVTVNNKDIEDFNYQPTTEKVALNQNQIINLIPTEVNSFAQIPIPNSKTIIGIGESVHGSKSISEIEVQMMKKLIENHNCRLLLFEANMYQMLLANLFIQGKFSENSTNILNETASYTTFSSTLFCDFMWWLRKYNETVTDKVRVYGILDLNYHIYVNPLFDYLYAFYNKQTDSEVHPLLQLLYDRKFTILKDTMQFTQLAQVMGKQNYSDFLYALSNVPQYLQLDSLSFNTNLHRIFMRDYQMFEIAERYMSENIKTGETVCIVAHLGHLNKKDSNFPYFRSMGSLLKDKYEDSYFVTGIFAGRGSIASVSLNEKALQPMDLSCLRDGSIESLCYKNDLPCFYYSTSNLSGSNYYYRRIGNSYIKQSEYWYGNLKSRIDGFIFISKSQAIDNPFYLDEFVLACDKIESHTNIIKNIKP
jgi:erythromycin esterase-like protein